MMITAEPYPSPAPNVTLKTGMKLVLIGNSQQAKQFFLQFGRKTI